jgi:transposase-like protein
MGEASVRYSESFKRQVVGELASGGCRSHQEARRRYGIGGAGTVGKWVRQYGPAHMQRRVIRVETLDERSEVAALKARIKELERAVVDSKVQEALHKAYFDIVCREYGVSDPAEVKKNIAAKLSGEESSTGKGGSG